MSSAPANTERRVLRVQGRFYERLAEIALERTGRTPADTAAADAVSRPRLFRVGGGMQARMTLTRDQAMTVAEWLEELDTKPARQIRQLLRTWDVTR